MAMPMEKYARNWMRMVLTVFVTISLVKIHIVFLRDIILYVLHRKTQTEMLPLTMETIFYNKSLNQEIADAEHGHPFFLGYKDFRNSHIKKILTQHV